MFTNNDMTRLIKFLTMPAVPERKPKPCAIPTPVPVPVPVSITIKEDAPVIDRVVFQDTATIVFWKDGTKTVVKTQNGEPFDKEKGLAMAFVKKVCGNSRNYYEMFLEYCGEDETEPVEEKPPKKSK